MFFVASASSSAGNIGTNILHHPDDSLFPLSLMHVPTPALLTLKVADANNKGCSSSLVVGACHKDATTEEQLWAVLVTV